LSAMGSVVDGLLRDSLIDARDLAEMLGTSSRSVARWQKTGSTPRRETEVRLLEVQAVADLLRRVMREDFARIWLHSPNPDLGYEKPLELIAQGKYRRVIGAILALAEGVTA
jgi:hypothetical protein